MAEQFLHPTTLTSISFDERRYQELIDAPPEVGNCGNVNSPLLPFPLDSIIRSSYSSL